MTRYQIDEASESELIFSHSWSCTFFCSPRSFFFLQSCSSTLFLFNLVFICFRKINFWLINCCIPFAPVQPEKERCRLCRSTHFNLLFVNWLVLLKNTDLAIFSGFETGEWAGRREDENTNLACFCTYAACALYKCMLRRQLQHRRSASEKKKITCTGCVDWFVQAASVRNKHTEYTSMQKWENSCQKLFAVVRKWGQKTWRVWKGLAFWGFYGRRFEFHSFVQIVEFSRFLTIFQHVSVLKIWTLSFCA